MKRNWAWTIRMPNHNPLKKRQFLDLEFVDQRRDQVPRRGDHVVSQQVYMVVILSVLPPSNPWLFTGVTVQWGMENDLSPWRPVDTGSDWYWYLETEVSFWTLVETWNYFHIFGYYFAYSFPVSLSPGSGNSLSQMWRLVLSKLLEKIFCSISSLLLCSTKSSYHGVLELWFLSPRLGETARLCLFILFSCCGQKLALCSELAQ